MKLERRPACLPFLSIRSQSMSCNSHGILQWHMTNRRRHCTPMKASKIAYGLTWQTEIEATNKRDRAKMEKKNLTYCRELGFAKWEALGICLRRGLSLTAGTDGMRAKRQISDITKWTEEINQRVWPNTKPEPANRDQRQRSPAEFSEETTDENKFN